VPIIAGNIRIGVLVRGHNGTDNLHLIHKAVFKQRANRTINQTRGQRLFFAGPRFALEKSTRNFAD
jgi:hypothetical protein